MEDIRLNGNDGDYLILETADGAQYRLVNDESLHGAIKKSRSGLAPTSMSPRDMQEAVRNGFSLEDIVEQSGASFEFVEKFAAPVIAELSHIIASAKTLRVPSLGEGQGQEFGDFVESRLSSQGAKNVAWSTKRTDFNVWHITVTFDNAGQQALALWSFDPKRLVLSPENERAVQIGKREDAPAAFLGGLVSDTSSVHTPQSPVKLSVVDTPSDLGESVLPSVNVAEVAQHETIEVGSHVEENAPLSATADLLQALRRKRAVTEAESDTAATQPIEIVDAKAEDSQTESEGTVKKGRASMPSWDQIVFGTKTED